MQNTYPTANCHDLFTAHPRWRPEELALPVPDAAQALLGSYLLHASKEGLVILRITETEAYGGSYRGHIDDASHAHRGRTERNAPMFAAPAHCYIYLIYGIYHCLNIVTGKEGIPAAVLIRGGEIVYGHKLVRMRRKNVAPKNWTNGPGKVCLALGLTRAQNDRPLTSGRLVLRHGDLRKGEKIRATVRHGIDYAEHGKDFPWRYYIAD